MTPTTYARCPVCDRAGEVDDGWRLVVANGLRRWAHARCLSAIRGEVAEKQARPNGAMEEEKPE